jgi:hypothetical protein
MSLDEPQETESSGWHAIERALDPLYADQPPKHYGSLISYRLGGPDPLRGISAYYRTTPVPHWHFITYGLSELFEKESSDPEISGYGFELTFRLACSVVVAEPPMWALNFLQNLARYVFDTGNVFTAGAYMHLNGPICLDTTTLIDAMAVVVDPELPRIDTPNGSVEFLQIVGITTQEQMAIIRWNGTKVMGLFSSRLPLYVTDLDRFCLTSDLDIRTSLEEGSNREGSMTGTLFMDHLEWTSSKPWFGPRKHVITLGALQVAEIATILPLRLRFGRSLALVGKELNVLFEQMEDVCIREDQNVLKVGFPEVAWMPLLNVLKPIEGLYSVPELPHLIIEVQVTQITHQDGQVERTVG